jgi:putative endonuclease
VSDPTETLWYLYVVRTVDNFLYTGITTDVDRRYAEHCAGGARASRYLRAHPPAELLWSRPIGSKGAALKAEYRFKQFPRTEKERLILGGWDE